MNKQKKKDQQEKKASREKKLGNFQIRRWRISKGVLTAWMIGLCVAGIIGYNFYQHQRSLVGGGAPPARVKGSPQARLKIIEYIDLQCPHCALGAMTLKSYLDRYPGDIYLEMRYFPLGQLNSMISAIYAECAATQDKFWELTDLLLERQSQWRKIKDVQDLFWGMAQEAGLDLNALSQCVTSGKARATILADKAKGDSLIIKSTPTYFINGQMVVGYENLKKELGKNFEDK